MVQVPLDSANHADDTGRAHHRSIFREWIADHGGLKSFRAKQRVALSIYDRDLNNFLVAEAGGTFDQTVGRFGVRQTMRRPFRGWKTRREFVVAIMAGNFLYQVNPTSHVTTPRNLPAFPHRREGSFAAAIRVHAHGMESKRAQNVFHFSVRDIRAHHAQDFLSRQMNFLFGLAGRIHIHNASENFAARYLLN